MTITHYQSDVTGFLSRCVIITEKVKYQPTDMQLALEIATLKRQQSEVCKKLAELTRERKRRQRLRHFLKTAP